MLESSRRPADFLWLLFVACTVLIILSPLSPAPFLSSPLSFSLVYLWSRLNPNVRLSLFGVVQITAPYLPYALATFSWALNSSFSAVVGDVLGIATGHFVRSRVESWSDRARSISSTTSGTRSVPAAVATGSRRPKCCALACPPQH